MIFKDLSAKADPEDERREVCSRQTDVKCLTAKEKKWKLNVCFRCELEFAIWEMSRDYVAMESNFTVELLLD